MKDVSAKFVDEDLERVLDAVLGKVNLSYRMNKELLLCSGEVKEGKRSSLWGSVTDEKKHPLPG